EALRYYQESLNIYSKKVNYSEEEIAEANYYIAEIYYLTNEYDKSVKLINQNIDNAYAEAKIRYFELLAFIYQIKGNIIEASKNYQNAIDLTIDFYGDKSINVAIEYLNYTLFLLVNIEYKEATNTLEKAYGIIKVTQPVFGNELADYYNLKGRYFRNLPIKKQDIRSFSEEKKRNLNKAINYYSKALSAIKFPVPYSLDDINNSANWLSLIDCINYLKRIGDTYKEIAKVEQNKESENYIESLTDAIDSYKIVGALIQKARMELSSDESKIQLTELEYSTFQNLIETAFDVYTVTNNTEFIELAFINAERIKSSSVFDKLSNESAIENSLIPDSLIQLERRFNNTIAIYSEKLFQENNEDIPDTFLLGEYNTQIFEASRKREELNRYLESEFSDYYELKYAASLLSISKIQQKLKYSEIILEYVLNEKDSLTALYTFVISKNKMDLIKQNVGIDFLKSIETMFHFMSDREYILTTNAQSKQFCVSANQLYKNLILPFYDEIKNKKLTIVPDGKLSYIAFDGLLHNLPDTTKTIQFNKLDYLIKEFSINYSNSSNLLFKKNRSTKKIINRAIAFAPEYQSDTFEIANQKIVLIPLPGAQKDVLEISKTINTNVFKGSEATESNFRSNIENYDILHLAMHAYINDSLPELSRLAFTFGTSENANSDGWLNTSDIYNLNT
ncbi:MAG: CHAT domain-containing protein, partial [Draconibacterium sp.]|nr:CHAT domain-containing protein [Draconibacterium sp.]